MLKLSKRDNRKKSIDDIKNIKQWLKKEPSAKRILDKYKFNINEIDNLKIQFDDMDVSAKTINGDIFLNKKMLNDNWKDYRHYVLHELVHHCQHLTNKCVENNDNVDYLDNPAETEAFREQLKYRLKTEPQEEVEQYITDLFDKHDVPKSERKEKKKELLGK